MKMRLRYLLLPLLIALTGTGCLREDLSDCPPPATDNVKIYFQYLGDGTTDILFQKMSRVELYVFDEWGKNLEKLRYDREQLEAFAAKPSFKLPKGRYSIVAIGNPLEYTQVVNIDRENDFDKMYIEAPRYPEDDNHVVRQDPNYMGQLDLEVMDETTVVYDTLTLKSSHVDVVIDVKGLPAPTRQQTELPYTFRIEQANRRTDFNNEVVPDSKVNIYPEFEYLPDRGIYRSVDLAVYRMKDPQFEGSLTQDWWCQHRLAIYKGTDLIYTISAAEYVEQHGSVIDLTKQEALLPVEIDLTGGTVKVEVPKWYIQDSTPDYE